MASSDSIDVTIRGLGGHGAAPDRGKDPVVVAAEFIIALQTIVSRERPPLDPVVVTVGSIHGGTKRNIIPDEVRLYLTVRTMKPEVRDRVLDAIQRIPRGIAVANGLPEDRMPVYEHLPAESIASTFNDPALNERLVTAIGTELGADNVVLIDPSMVSEDFGLFGDGGKIPTVMLALGAADSAKLAAGTQPGLHSARFAPADPSLVLRTGVRAAVSGVLGLLGR
jgi:hippurate hydrolase